MSIRTRGGMVVFDLSVFGRRIEPSVYCDTEYRNLSSVVSGFTLPVDDRL